MQAKFEVTLETLSDREREVLRLVALSYASKGSADQLALRRSPGRILDLDKR